MLFYFDHILQLVKRLDHAWIGTIKILFIIIIIIIFYLNI